MSSDDIKQLITEDVRYLLNNEDIPKPALYALMIRIRRVANDYKRNQRFKYLIFFNFKKYLYIAQNKSYNLIGDIKNLPYSSLFPCIYKEYFLRLVRKLVFFYCNFLNLKGEKEMNEKENSKCDELTQEELGAIIKYYMEYNNLSAFSLFAKLDEKNNLILNAMGGVNGSEVATNE